MRPDAQLTTDAPPTRHGGASASRGGRRRLAPGPRKQLVDVGRGDDALVCLAKPVHLHRAASGRGHPHRDDLLVKRAGGARLHVEDIPETREEKASVGGGLVM